MEEHKSETTTLPPAVVEATQKRIRENTSEVARNYSLEQDIGTGAVSSLKEILGKFDQETKRTVLDDTISPEDARKGIDEYVDTLIDRGFSPAEALAKAEAEYDELVSDEGGFLRSLPSQAAPGTEVDQDLARSLIQEAGGDREKARDLARQRGLKF